MVGGVVGDGARVGVLVADEFGFGVVGDAVGVEAGARVGPTGMAVEVAAEVPPPAQAAVSRLISSGATKRRGKRGIVSPTKEGGQ